MAKKKFKFDSVEHIKTESDVDSNKLIKNSLVSLGISSSVIGLQPHKIANWIYRDRSEFELGSIDDLANSIKTKGQAQPIVVVLASETFKARDNPDATYVVIAGYRRWLACLKHDMEVDAIVKDIEFNDAIALLDAENEKESVSEYSKGMFYHSLINSNKITRDNLRVRLSLKPASLSNLLSFGDVPKEIWHAVSDVSKVSSRTASVLRSFVNKDKHYVQKIIDISDQIKSGAGEKVITNLLMSSNTKENKKIQPEKFKIKNKLVCEFKNRDIVFNKSINDKDMEEIKEEIKNLLSRYYER